MKFAKVNGNKVEAQRGLRGTCELCGSEMISKYGTERIHHWAHKNKVVCDHWWENQTEWHRTWKDHFPTEWQEKVLEGTNEEKHRADIKTDKEFVIEFQHSAIKSDEVKSREAFYGNMVWVVDGTRLKGDYLRFCKGRRSLRNLNNSGLFLSTSPEECFPANWLKSSVLVCFDFQADRESDILWCLIPEPVGGCAVIYRVPKKRIIDLSSNSPHLLRFQVELSEIKQGLQLEREAMVQK